MGRCPVEKLNFQLEKQTPYKSATDSQLCSNRLKLSWSLLLEPKSHKVTHENVLQSIIPPSFLCLHGGATFLTVKDGAPCHNH
ncbi:hypothetical protein TNCV_1272871 [Trichonephila clavipes]|nr:hypothetical protein TNCV_1272871 [Trichonephila clavipes]